MTARRTLIAQARACPLPIEIEIAPAGRDRFHAHVGGRKLGTSGTPFLTAARVLLASGTPAWTPIVMRANRDARTHQAGCAGQSAAAEPE
jgi:hypothetical protein